MSTTTESQPQRAMLSAEAELGMPSQPLTATPPFFQSVFSLFSRKASLPLSLISADNGHGCVAGSIRCCAEPPCAGISRPLPYPAPDGADFSQSDPCHRTRRE